jgi:hypothetical protein
MMPQFDSPNAWQGELLVTLRPVIGSEKTARRDPRRQPQHQTDRTLHQDSQPLPGIPKFLRICPDSPDKSSWHRLSPCVQ